MYNIYCHQVICKHICSHGTDWQVPSCEIQLHIFHYAEGCLDGKLGLFLGYLGHFSYLYGNAVCTCLRTSKYVCTCLNTLYLLL